MIENANQKTKKVFIFFLTVLLLLLLFSLCSEIITRTVSGLLNIEQSYGLLILLISMYMLWDAKYKIADTRTAPAIIPGIVVVILGLGIILFSKLSHTLMLQGIALIITIIGIIWVVLGSSLLKLVIIPVSYLAFMFSIFEEVLGNFSIGLQLITAKVASILLELSGMPVFLDREYIQLPHIILEVAKVCSGIHHIIALVALAIPIAVKAYTSVVRRVALVLMAFLTGLLANGLRVALIGWWTVNHKEETIHGPFEFLYVSFILICGLIIVGSISFYSRSKEKEEHKKSHDSKTLVFIQSYMGSKTIFPISLVCILLLIVIGFESYVGNNKVPPNLPLSEFPRFIHQWRSEEVDDDAWPFKNLTGDRMLKRIYFNQDTGDKLGLLIVYYDNQKQDKELINQRLMWLHLKDKEIAIEINNSQIKINTGSPRGLESQTYIGDKRHFFFWYFINGKILTDPYSVKLETFISAITKGATNAALVVFSTENQDGYPIESDQTIEFIKFAIPYVLKICKTDL